SRFEKKYNGIGEEITGEVDNRGLTYTRSSFLSYRDTLLNKNFQNSTQIQKQIQEGKNQVAGIITEGENYNQIQGMIQSAQNLNQQGAENKERVEKLLAQSKELAEKNIGEGLLDGLQEMIASIQSSLPQEVSNNGVSQYIQAQEKELAEKQEKANELLSHMNSLVTNNNDLAALQALLQGSSQGLNLAANSAVSKYLDDYAKKLQKDNEERSSNLQKTLLESLTNGDDYKYLRDAGYGFRVDGEGITAYREVYSGEIEINGSAMKSTSYSPDLEYQYIRIETKFNPGNLKVDLLNPNNTTFSAEMVSGVKGYIDDLQKNVEVMFAQFSDKTKEVKEEYVQNEEIESYQKKLYEASKDNYLAAFQGLPGEFKEAFEGEMGNTKDYHTSSRYSFSAGSFKGQSGDMKKIGKSMYDGLDIDDSVLGGSRELKGNVTIKGVPVEVNYGMQYLIVTSGFDISKIGFNFNLKGLGTNYVDNQLSGVSQKYSIYTKDIQSRIERQAKANDEEMDKKGFVFNVLNGMSGGQKVTQAVEGEIRSRVTGAIAEATGLPASFVGALVGGSNMKQAMKAYEKSVTTEAISKATGIPSWYLDQKIAEKEANHAMTTSFSYNMATTLVGSLKYSPPLLAAQALIPGLKEDVNKFVDHVGREAYKNRETIDAAVTVAMTVAAPMTGGMSLVALAGYNVVKGATEGGVLGALAGVANIGNAYLSTYTFGAVSYNLSYSYADGFGASVGGGWQVAKGLGVGATLSYNEQSGFGASVGFQAGTSALSFNGGLSYSQRDGVSANAGVGIGLGGKKPTGSLNLGVSYNKQDGLGTSAGISSNNNKITHGMGLNITKSEYGGWGADVSTDQYGPGNLSGGLAYSQRDGFTVSLNVNGTNAISYNSQSGLSGNGDFMSQYAMNNGLAQGVAEDTDTSEPNSAQQHNNTEQGAQVIEGAGVSTTRREGEGGETTHYYDKDGNMRIRVTDSNGDSYYRAATPEEAHRIQNNNGYTMASDTGKPSNNSHQNSESGNLKPVKSYENTGFFEGIGQRFNNLLSGNGFNTDANLIRNAEIQGGKLAGLLKASELGYASSLADVREVMDYYQRNNRDNNLQAQTAAGARILSQAEALLRLNAESPFQYKMGNTGLGGVMDCTGFVYRANQGAGFEHIPYIGGSSIEVSDHYKPVSEGERVPGDIKIITIRDKNGKVVDGHAMIYNGGQPGKEFYEMSSKGMKPNKDYMENHYIGIYGKKMENEGYTMEGGYYRPLEK
ncbi:hypothetical protein LEP1GSC186_4784, partial [Leptospira noguchii serovar Autumnalis str. ZUN142]